VFEFIDDACGVIGLIGTEESCPMIVEINSNLSDRQTRLSGPATRSGRQTKKKLKKPGPVQMAEKPCAGTGDFTCRN